MTTYISNFHRDPRRKRGAVAVTIVVCLTTLFIFAAITVDVGLMYNTRADLQLTADSAALAAASALVNESRVEGDHETAFAEARNRALSYTGFNRVMNNEVAAASGDIIIGYMANPRDPNDVMQFGDQSKYNSVRVLIRRDSTLNGPVEMLFSQVFGHQETEITAAATAGYLQGISGFKVTDETGPAGVLPITLKESVWEDLLDGTFTSGDNYAYDPVTGNVTPGPDGIFELNLYPGADLPAGNFGTVNIGTNSNSTAHLASQIINGLTAEDLEYHGGELSLGDDGTLSLTGDTGLSAELKDELTAIIGEPRIIPIFSTVSGPGDNADFTIVGWVGLRIMYVKLTGPMAGKKVIIQPANVVDDAAISNPGDETSQFVNRPLQLFR